MNDLESRVLSALESLRPFLVNDGGDIEFIEITPELVVKVRLLGACSSCSMRHMTMKAGVEETIKKAAPEISAVESVPEDLFTI
ncbi:MAG: NifU family protein [Bacteroidia bacterium]|nr:NifU family protein [Bacteroidia bacterium]